MGKPTGHRPLYQIFPSNHTSIRSFFRFPQRCSWGFRSSKIWRRLTGWLMPGISRQCGLIFKCCRLFRSTLFRNVGPRSASDAASYPRIRKTSRKHTLTEWAAAEFVWRIHTSGVCLLSAPKLDGSSGSLTCRISCNFEENSYIICTSTHTAPCTIFEV